MTKLHTNIPFGYFTGIIILLSLIFTSVSYAQYNGECWAADYTNVFIIAADGSASQIGGFSQPMSISINPNDGTAWVADTDMIQVRKFSPQGQELKKLDGAANASLFAKTPQTLTNPISVAVDPNDGACWVATKNNIIKFSPEAKQLFIQEGFNEPFLAVNPNNGDCWVADSSNARVVRLSKQGKQLDVIQIDEITQPKSISVNPADGSCWILDPFTYIAAKISSDGKISSKFNVVGNDMAMMATAIAASSDGGCWVGLMIDMMNDKVIKLSADGKRSLEVAGFGMPSRLVEDPRDKSCWVADTNGGQIAKISAGGQMTPYIQGLQQPKVVEVASPVK
ncbi:hypothetical protein GF312_06865 [Candidatus Poribacteria bacterium]|nr:hypothetical protein [Candidatus Poribacteria bacterium]